MLPQGTEMILSILMVTLVQTQLTGLPETLCFLTFICQWTVSDLEIKLGCAWAARDNIVLTTFTIVAQYCPLQNFRLLGIKI